LGGAEACRGGLNFASKTLFSVSTVAVRIVAIQQEIVSKILVKKVRKPNGFEGL